MASNMPVGRGRGRGRAIISSQLQRPGGEPAAQKSTKEHIKDLNPKTLESTIEYLTRRTVSQEVLNEATTELCTRVLNDVDFVKQAVELIDKLWNSNEPDNVSIRKPLLSRLQEFYKTRDNLLEGELQAYATLLAELFSILRLSDQPLKAFVAPVYNILKDLIDREDRDQNNILTFHDIILRHGFLLDKQDQVKMSDLMEKIRNAAVTETKNKVRQCIFLEVIELYAGSWQMEKDVKIFYSDSLAEQMEKILDS